MSQDDVVTIHSVCGKIVTRPDGRGQRSCLHCDRKVPNSEVKVIPRPGDMRPHYITTQAE